MRRNRDLTVQSLNLADINDKLGTIAGITQHLDDTGNMWLGDLTGIMFATAQLSPTIVAANSESTQTFGVAGVVPGDGVIVIKPTKQSDLSLLDSRVPSANTIAITFRNFSGAGITPTANEKYVVVVLRRS